MPDPDQERIEGLAEAVVRLTRRQYELEQRVHELEMRAGIPEPPPAVHAAVPPPLPRPRPQPLPQLPVPPPVQPSPALETTVGLNWINRIAVITLILGAGFLFKYGIDNNWIGPGVRVIMGISAALIALLAGDRLWKREQQVFAQGVMGLGLALLYLSFYAAAPLYHLIPTSAAFALMTLTTVAAGALAMRYESQVIAVLGLIGGYLTPPALSTGENRPWVLFGYLFLLNLGALAVARLRRWRALEPLAFVATAILYGAWGATQYSESQRTVATVFAFAFYAQFAAAETRAMWWLAQLLAPLAAAGIWQNDTRLLPLALIFAAGGLAVAELRQWAEAPEWTLACFWLPVWAWSTTGVTSGNRVLLFEWISAGFALFFLWTLWWILARRRPMRAAELFVLAAGPAAYYATSYWLLNDDYHRYMGLLAAGLGGLHLILARLFWKTDAARLAVGVAFAFVTLAVPIQFTAFRVTIAWALEGAVLAWLAARFATKWLDAGAAMVLVLTTLRLFSVDAWMYLRASEYPALINARFLTFLISAVSLWLTARFLKAGIGAGAAYVAGHVVMLWILCLEAAGAVERGAAAADQGSMTAVAISILMALYAVFLVTLGVLTRTAINRILGLALVGAVVAKLYLIDVWELGRVFRITAFLGLGVLLLAVSYLYSRFRPSLEKLLRGDSVN